MTTRYCRRCDCPTDHSKIRVNVMGDTDEGVVSRFFWGVLSLGANEALADRYLECNECGARRKP